ERADPLFRRQPTKFRSRTRHHVGGVRWVAWPVHRFDSRLGTLPVLYRWATPRGNAWTLSHGVANLTISAPTRTAMTQPHSTRPITGLLTAVTALVAATLRVLALLPNVYAMGALGLYSGGRLRWWLAWVPPMAGTAVPGVLLE